MWDGEGCFVLDYLRQEDPPEPRRRFVSAVKAAGDHLAIEAAGWIGYLSTIRPRARPWDDEGCFALDYVRHEDPAEPRRQLVWAFKAGHDHAIRQAADLTARAIASRTTQWGDSLSLLIPVPGHQPRLAASPQERMCRFVGALVSQPMLVTVALRRVRQIRRSAGATTRPTASEHLRTLECSPTVAGATVLLVDDVFTFGRVTEACRVLLLDRGARSVHVLCLARTQSP